MVPLEEHARHDRVARVTSFKMKPRIVASKLGERARVACKGDDGSSLAEERLGDASAESPASADDKRGLPGQSVQSTLKTQHADSRARRARSASRVSQLVGS